MRVEKDKQDRIIELLESIEWILMRIWRCDEPPIDEEEEPIHDGHD